MSNRIIINNDTDLPDDEAMRRVQQVIGEGRASNFGKQYCYVSTWSDKIICYVTKNKNSDSFRLYKE